MRPVQNRKETGSWALGLSTPSTAVNVLLGFSRPLEFRKGLAATRHALDEDPPPVVVLHSAHSTSSKARVGGSDSRSSGECRSVRRTENFVSRNSPSLAVALNCGKGSGS